MEKTVKLKDKILLRKRFVIETVNDELKNRCQIEHSRHRSFSGFLANTIAALIAYSFLPKKPAIKYQTLHSTQLTVFQNRTQVLRILFPIAQLKHLTLEQYSFLS